MGSFVAALVVRLHWNLHVHPLGDYIYSDMNGYVQRADRLLKAPWQPHEYSAFFPFGTHWLLAGIKAVFGHDNYAAFGVVYALLGAATVTMAYASAKRASRFAFVAPTVAVVGIFYYPMISLGGYILSETPFAFCLTAALVCALRLVDHGRPRDAWLMGLCAGLGALFRPQMMLSVAGVGLYWLARRRALPGIRWGHLGRSAIPLALCLGLGSKHMHFNTGRYGFISENGSFNLVFGRCHNSKIESLPDGKGHGKVHFRPPPLLQVDNREKRAIEAGTVSPVRLDPALTDVLSYKGYIGDRHQHMDYIRQCMAKTGILGQLRYTWTNVLLVWMYNVPWPDSGRSTWTGPAKWWTYQSRNWLAIPALLGLVFIVIPRKETAKLGLFGINLLALLILAGLFFGDARGRAPYDFIILTLALEVYATIGVFVVRWIVRWQEQRRQPTGSPTGSRGDTSAQSSSSS